MIIKMVAGSFQTIIIDKLFITQERRIKKILSSLRFSFQLGLSASYVPNSDNRNQNIIILFTVEALTALLVKLISSIKKNKIVIERNEFPAAILNNKPFGSCFYKYFVLSWQYKLYDGLFLMTDELINFYKKYTKRKCIIQKLPMTVDFSRFDNKNGSCLKDRYIAYTGSLSNKKDGIIYLIRAFKKISEQIQDVKLKIAGGNEEEINRLRKYSEELGVGNRIDFLGLISRDSIPYLLQNSMVLVLPRPGSSQARGGFPTKLGEYLASSKPVIVTKVGEIPFYLGDNEVFFISADNIEEELVSTLTMVFDNYDYALKIGRRGRQKALKYFSLEANTDKIAKLLNKLAYEDI